MSAKEARGRLLRAWSPSLMVCTSPELDQICADSNGLYFADLLRPFGLLRGLNGGVGGKMLDLFDYVLDLHAL